MYLDPKKEKMKYGLWEGGKRSKWFDEQSIKLINQNQLDYTNMFTEPESTNFVRPNANFNKSKDFDYVLTNLKRKLKVPA